MIHKLKLTTFSLILILVLGFVFFLTNTTSAIGPVDDLSVGGKPFGGKIKLIIPPGAGCPFKKIKVGNPVPVEAYVISADDMSGGILGKIPGISDILELFSPTKVYEFKPISMFEWSLGLTWSKTVTKPIIEGLKKLPPPANVPFLACDSDTYVVRMIGTGAKPALGL